MKDMVRFGFKCRLSRAPRSDRLSSIAGLFLLLTSCEILLLAYLVLRRQPVIQCPGLPPCRYANDRLVFAG
jgi:hypothetical protein